MLRLVMGNTTFSITTVLCVFMGGLALGSYVGGRFVDRRGNALRLFAIVEGIIGVYCLLLPTLIDASEPIYRYLYQSSHTSFFSLSLVRFACCGLLLLAPASLMGATLPILTRFFVRSADQLGWSIGRLYAINTFGAAFGASLTGFWLIPNLGVHNSILMGSLINAVVCIVALLLSCLELATTGPGEKPAEGGSKRRAKRQKSLAVQDRSTTLAGPSYGLVSLVSLLIGYGISGAAALIYEIAWTRAIALVIGSSVYAFSMMLTAFILGIALGSVVCARFVDRLRAPMFALGLIQVAISLSALAVTPVFGEIPLHVTAMISRIGDSFWLLQTAEFGLALLIMLIPTTLMGAAFPLANRVFARGVETIGRSVGTVYGSNTLGSIVGSFLGGFVLVPLLGIQWTIFAAVFFNALVGCWFIGLSPHLTRQRRSLMAAAVIVTVGLCALFIPRWDKKLLTFGPFIQARKLSPEKAQSPAGLRNILDETEIVYHKEGLSSTVTVTKNRQGVLTLLSNGKAEATSVGGQLQQRLLAHLPLLLHPNPKVALNIGLASGITLGAAGRHQLDSLECVELSPEVIEATRLFEEYNEQILDDRRVQMLVADGRNHLALSDVQYDVIISQPSDPFTAGMADLFTREFFQLCRVRLAPEGIVCIWLRAETVHPDAFFGVVRTFAAVFEDATVWNVTRGGEYLLIGSNSKINVDYQTLVRRMEEPQVAADLKRMRIETVADLLAYLVMDRQGAIALGGQASLNTDDNAILEFSTPRNYMNRDAYVGLLEKMLQNWTEELSFLTGPDEDPRLAATEEKITRFRRAKIHVLRSRLYIEKKELDRADEQLMLAKQLNPADAAVSEYEATLFRRAAGLVPAGQSQGATTIYRRLVRIDPDNVKYRFELANSLRELGDLQGALTHYTRVVQIEPDHFLAHFYLAELSSKSGRTGMTIEHLRRAVAAKPDFTEAANNLAWLLATHKDPSRRDANEAVRLAEKACELTDRKQATLLHTLAVAYEAADRLLDARLAAEQALQRAETTGQKSLADLLQRKIRAFRENPKP